MDAVSKDARLALLRQYGGFAVAYSVTVQPRLRYFGDDRGYLAYARVAGTDFVLADPIAAPDAHEALIDAFLAEHNDVVFCQSSRRTAKILSSRSFRINEFGSENIVDLQTFAFSGPKLRSFRTAANRLAPQGYTVRELAFADLDRATVRAISDRWRRTRVAAGGEMRFLVRPVVLDDEPGVRKFFLFNGQGEPEGFAFFDPVYRDGRAVGYLSATRRWLPSTDPLAAYFLVRAAVETFQSEGVDSLYLGLSPFHRIEDKTFEKDWLTRRGFRFIYTNAITNRFIYPSQSLARHKAMYGGAVRQTYFAFNTTPSLPRLLKLLWLCRYSRSG